MILSEKNGLFFFQFPNLAGLSGLWHGIFLRDGGLSSKPFHSLNLSFHVGDREDHVKGNRRRISGCFGGGDLVFTRQMHGAEIRTITGLQSSEKAANPVETLSGDAMITDLQGKFLTVKLADCQPVILYDPNRRVVANVHSGWRGSVENIVGKTVGKMTKAFGCRASDIYAGIGPSLGPCCAEFIHYRTEIPQSLWKYKDDAHRFDFWAITRDQLCEAGVSSRNIHSSGICTRCNPHLFFSYRGEGRTGRFGAVAGLTPASGKGGDL